MRRPLPRGATGETAPPRWRPGDLGQPVGAGVVSAVTGFTSTAAVVLTGLAAVGASPDQAASGLLAICVVAGLTSIVIGLRLRIPVQVAWSTPGAALLATSASADFPTAVGAFLVTGALVVLTGLWGRLGRWLTAVPAPIAGAMLAGILLPLCLAPAHSLADQPWLTLPVLVVWVALVRWAPRWAVLGALAAAVVAVVAGGGLGPLAGADLAPRLELVVPDLDAGAVVGIALPLFVVTMAAQNVPGLAVLTSFGYRPPAGRLLTATGVATLVGAPFGAHALNLGALTAALCAGPDAGPDPRRRWVATTANGATLVVLGLASGALASAVVLSPALLVQAVAGLALLGSLGAALRSALSTTGDGEGPGPVPALVALTVTASGLSVAGVGSAFWGLLAGLVLDRVLRPRHARRDGAVPAR